MSTFSQYENYLGAAVLSQNAEAALNAQVAAEDAYIKAKEILESATGLKTTIKSAENTIAALQDLQANIESLSNTVTVKSATVTNAYDNLQTNIAANRALLTQIETDLSAAEAVYNNATTLNRNTAETANTAIATLNSTATQINSDINNATATLLANYQTYLQSLTSTYNSDDTALISRCNTLLANLQSEYDDIEAGITALVEEAESDVDSYINNIQTQQNTTTTALNATVTTATQANANLQSSIASANIATSNLTTAVNTAQADIESARATAVTSAQNSINTLSNTASAQLATERDSAVNLVISTKNDAVDDLNDEVDYLSDNIDNMISAAELEADSIVDEAVASINTAADDAEDDIDAAATTALTFITTAQTNALANISASTDITQKVTKPAQYLTVASMSAAFTALTNVTAPCWVMVHIDTDVLYRYTVEDGVQTLTGVDGVYKLVDGTVEQSALGTGSGSGSVFGDIPQYSVEIPVTLILVGNDLTGATTGGAGVYYGTPAEVVASMDQYGTIGVSSALALYTSVYSSSTTYVDFDDVEADMYGTVPFITYSQSSGLAVDYTTAPNAFVFHRTVPVYLLYVTDADDLTTYGTLHTTPHYSITQSIYLSSDITEVTDDDYTCVVLNNLAYVAITASDNALAVDDLQDQIDDVSSDVGSLETRVGIAEAGVQNYYRLSSVLGNIETYSATVTYAKNDTVVYNGVVYKAKGSSTGVYPTQSSSKWTVLDPSDVCVTFKDALGLDISSDPRYTVFNGTSSEWTALSTAEKAKYSIVNLS